MATNDTDPQRTNPFADDASRTEPGAPPEADASAVAAGLLADLAKTPPPEQVSETDAHVAAAYAVAPHRPPRANDKTVENPAVFINATVPLPPPPSSGRVKLGPPAPSVVSMKGALTVPGGARLYEAGQAEITEPGERARTQMRVLLACIAGVVVAAVIAIVILAIAPARSQPQTTATPSATPSMNMTAASPGVLPSVAPQPSTSVIASPPTAATSAQPTHAPNKPHTKGSPGSPTPPSSGSFAAPDRSF